METFYVGEGIKLTDSQKAAYDAFVCFVDTAEKIGPALGPYAVMGGLLTAYIHCAHANGLHNSAIECIEGALHGLKNPEQILFTAEGRA